MRIAFAGTPDVAATALEALIGSEHEIVAVLTRPDARAGRGRKLVPSPVTELAASRLIPVLKPERVSDAADELAELAPDCVAVVAYGALIPAELLELPTHGWVNLHFSLLPSWRGAAPVQHAIWHGDPLTGATTFRIDEGLDTGPVFGMVIEPIRGDDTSGALLERLSHSGAELLVRTMDAIADGGAAPEPQPDDLITLAPKITTADAQVRWDAPAYGVDRQVRACTPAPGAWTTLGGERIKLGPVRLVDAEAPDGAEPGQIVRDGENVRVATGDGRLVELDRVQPPGKQMMAVADWLRGWRGPLDAFDAGPA